VIGTERHESRRIDNQLRGRSGRQGDPGSSRFFVSLQDDIMRLFGGERISRLMEMLKIPEDQPIEHNMVSKAIEQAQTKVENFNFDARKRVVEYDDVMNRQREIIYGKRRRIPDQKQIKANLDQEVENLIAMHTAEEKPNYDQILVNFCEILPLSLDSQKKLKDDLGRLRRPQKITALLKKLVDQAYSQRQKQLGEQTMRQIERFVWLQTIDKLWVDHLDMMDDLREGVGLRGYAQQDPLVEYKKEAYGSFERLVGVIDYEMVRRLFRVQVAQRPAMPRQVRTNEDRQQTPRRSPRATSGRGKKKIGRNDPCPCGATKPDGKPKKYKHCCYPKYG